MLIYITKFIFQIYNAISRNLALTAAAALHYAILNKSDIQAINQHYRRAIMADEFRN